MPYSPITLPPDDSPLVLGSSFTASAKPIAFSMEEKKVESKLNFIFFLLKILRQLTYPFFYFLETKRASKPAKSSNPITTKQFKLDEPVQASGTIPTWTVFKTTANLARTTSAIPIKSNPLKDYIVEAQISLQLTDIKQNNNKYYVIELHKGTKKDGKDDYRVFCHYGRTCDLEKKPDSGIKQYRLCNSLENAKV